MTVDISIALATYNGESFLSQQLDSLADQTYPIKEIIISDNESTDKTIEIITAYQKILPIKLLINPVKGVNSNFFNAIDLCASDFIAICDQDDIWHPEKLAKLVESITASNEIQLVYGRSICIDENDSLIEAPSALIPSWTKQQFHDSPLNFIYQNCISGHAMLFRKKLIAVGKESLPQNLMYDWWLAVKASCKGHVVWNAEAITYHRIHAKNTHNSNNRYKKKLPKAEKYKQRHEKYLAQNIRTDFILMYVLQHAKSLIDSERRFVNTILSRNKKCYFSLKYFISLFQMRHRIFVKKPLKQAYNLSFGEDYFGKK